MKEWLRETHGPGFELLRHFLLRFFDSDLVTTSGQTGPALAGALSIFVPMFPLIEQPLRHKYAYLSHLAVPGPYRLAVRADELWLITLMMSAIGLLTAIKWQALFPGLNPAGRGAARRCAKKPPVQCVIVGLDGRGLHPRAGSHQDVSIGKQRLGGL
jgi:hypothetical protein